jgi:hypothetical protein
VDNLGSTDRVGWIENEHRRVSDHLDRLQRAIVILETAPVLRPDTAALLTKYRENKARLHLQRTTLELERHALLLDSGNGRPATDDLPSGSLVKG